LAIGLVFVLTLLVARLVSGAWPVLLPELFGQAEPLFPVARVALVTAVLLVAGPELVRPFRRAGWLIVLLMFIIAIALGYGLPGDAIGGLGLGLVSATIVLVVFGSARGFPDVEDVKSGLRALGVEVQDVTVAAYQRWGARTFDGYTSAGEPIRVGVYGRDAKDAQRVAIWWRSIWYRDSGPALTSSPLHQLEHEALLTITAQNIGVPCSTVYAAGEPTKKTALIALSARGDGVEAMDSDDVDDAVLVDLWQSVGRLHRNGIAHGRLNEHAVRISGGRASIEDFHAASAAAPVERIQGDVAELLSTDRSSRGTPASPRRQGTCDATALRSVGAIIDPQATPRQWHVRHGSTRACIPLRDGRAATPPGLPDAPDTRSGHHCGSALDSTSTVLVPTGEPRPAATRPPRHPARSPPAQPETSAKPTASELPAAPHPKLPRTPESTPQTSQADARSTGSTHPLAADPTPRPAPTQSTPPQQPPQRDSTALTKSVAFTPRDYRQYVRSAVSTARRDRQSLGRSQ